MEAMPAGEADHWGSGPWARGVGGRRGDDGAEALRLAAVADILVGSGDVAGHGWRLAATMRRTPGLAAVV